MSPCDGGDRAGDFRSWTEQVVHHGVHRRLHLAPRALRLVELGALPCLSFLADDLSNAPQLACDILVGRDDVVEGVGNLAVQSRPVHRELHREIAASHALQDRQELPPVERSGGHGFRHRGGTVAVASTGSWHNPGLRKAELKRTPTRIFMRIFGAFDLWSPRSIRQGGRPYSGTGRRYYKWAGASGARPLSRGRFRPTVSFILTPRTDETHGRPQ